MLCLSFGGAEDARPAPAIDTTGSYSVETEELYAENEGQQIYGLLYQPVGAEGARPMVIYAHGFGSSYRNGDQFLRSEIISFPRISSGKPKIRGPVHKSPDG